MTYINPVVAQQLAYGSMPIGYGVPQMGMPQMGYGMPQQMPYGMPGQPVYINSLAQLPPGAIPVSQQMLAQALGQSGVGALQVQPEQPSIVGSVVKGAGIGAAAGAAFGIIPFLPLGLFSGALVGAGVGATIGLVRGIAARRQQGEFHTMSHEQQVAAAQAQMVAATPPGARSVGSTASVAAKPAVRRPATHRQVPPVPAEKVVMTPEMRARRAKRIAAEQAAAKAAAARRAAS